MFAGTAYIDLPELTVQFEQEADERWLAVVEQLPGVMKYGNTPIEAYRSVVGLALRVLAEKAEAGEELA